MRQYQPDPPTLQKSAAQGQSPRSVNQLLNLKSTKFPNKRKGGEGAEDLFKRDLRHAWMRATAVPGGQEAGQPGRRVPLKGSSAPSPPSPLIWKSPPFRVGVK